MGKRGMTVGELRAALVGVDDAMEVTIRDAFGDSNFCGGIVSAETEDNCGGVHFAIDCTDDADLLDELEDTK